MMFSTRKSLCLLTFLYLVVVSECRGQGYKPSPKCATNECPPYTVVYTQKEFEIRSYKDAQWVSGPKIPSKSYKAAATEGFLLLFGYYGGNNVPRVVINMTAPVLVDAQNSAYTVFFYVPEKYQKSIPQPLSKDIKPVKLPKHKYAAVRRFDGFLSDDSIPTEVAKLKGSLKGTPYQRAADLNLATLAAYNSPFELVGRVNEVFLWFD